MSASRGSLGRDQDEIENPLRLTRLGIILGDQGLVARGSDPDVDVRGTAAIGGWEVALEAIGSIRAGEHGRPIGIRIPAVGSC